jgi:hypothetical protein
VPTSRFQRASVCAVLLLTIVPLLGVQAAGAAPLVQERTAQRRQLQHKINHVRRSGSHSARRLERRADKVDRGLKLVSPRSMNSGRWRRVHRAAARRSQHLHAAARRAGHGTAERIRQLKAQVRSLSAWLDIWGVFKTCPVAGPHLVNNNFGIIVQIPGVPIHVHQGNDITAATGTPIVAPFEGTAVVSPNLLGGLAVKVYGAAGYVYNAHLSAYAHLGHVNAGEVIGYVGSTGDAGGPHDHFEWHPGNGSAVDPNPLLSVVC